MGRTMQMAIGIAIGAALWMPGAAIAQAGPEAAGAQPAGDLDTEPEALAALENMGRTLRALGSFGVESQASLELVLDSGRKIELDTLVEYRVKQPNRFFAQLKGGRKDREIYYDGHDLTVWAPSLKFYATAIEVDKTLSQLFVDAARDYGIELPLADLFFWGTEYAPVSSVTTAFKIGSMDLRGERVDQFAYSQGESDWQLWLSQETSLPRKVVITSRADPSMPEFSAFLDWKTDLRLDEKTFKFSPPEGASAIVFAKLDAADEAAGEGTP